MLHGLELCIELLVREFGQGESLSWLWDEGGTHLCCVLKHKKAAGRGKAGVLDWAERCSKQCEQEKNVGSARIS